MSRKRMKTPLKTVTRSKNVKTLKRAALAACLFGATSGFAHAHEQAIAFTEVSFIAEGPAGDCVLDGCRFEVAHRLVIHDAESTLMNVLGARADLVGDALAQARFEAYVAERFTLLDPETETPIPVTLLGGEVERGYYWVYQEGEIQPGQTGLLLAQSVLMDAISRQTNRVNVKYKDQVETFVFNTSVRPVLYEFGD